MDATCQKLNKLITEKKEGFVDEVKTVISDLKTKGKKLYWHNAVFFGCNCNLQKMKNLIRDTNLVQFEPSDDQEKHPGIVVKYKPESK